MNDDFLTNLREEPRPEFAGGLEARLREIDAERSAAAAPRPLRRLVPALAGAGLVAAVAFAFTLEPVRAAAQSFLDLFRVKRFAAVPVDPQRLQRLAEGGLDFKTLVAEQVQVVRPPQEPQLVAGPEEAGVAAGIAVGVPAVPPGRSELSEVAVAPASTFRVTVDTSKLEALALAAGADEIEIPAWWNGVVVDVEVPPVVALRYTRTIDRGDGQPPTLVRYRLLQSARPEVELPEGFDLSLLGRLGLRLTGMSAQEALTFSQAIDWRATLLVPVPVQGGTYREVEVNGRQGLLVTFKAPESAGTTPREQSLLLWSSADKVFALGGRGDGMALLESAESIR